MINSVGFLLTNDEIDQVTGGNRNETISEQEQENGGFHLTEHPLLLTGMIIGGVVVFVVYVYFCYRCCKATSSMDEDYTGRFDYSGRSRSEYFWRKRQYY